MRVLIVEDDKALADGLLRVLNQCGYAVDHAETGGQALRACAVEHYDLVLLDLGLPDMDGFEVLQQMRRNHEVGSVLILTARDFEVDRIHGLDLGADDYVSKPFSLPELEARVRALLRRSQAIRSQKLTLGRLTLDKLTRSANIGTEELVLTPREWAVLEYLLTRVGHPVNKELIGRTLSERGDLLSRNAIEVHISRLRLKLQEAGITIRTVRGFGYMMEERDSPVTQ